MRNCFHQLAFSITLLVLGCGTKPPPNAGPNGGPPTPPVAGQPNSNAVPNPLPVPGPVVAPQPPFVPAPPSVPVPAIAAEPKVALGANLNEEPLVLTTFATGMTLRLSNILYDVNGRIASYEALITHAGQSTAVRVRAKPAPGPAGLPEYTAEANGQAVTNLAAAAGSNLLGFAPKDPGGVVVTFSGTLQLGDSKIMLAYDENGRRHIESQSFSHSGKTYEIAYSGFAHDVNGRLTSYQAEIKKAG